MTLIEIRPHPWGWKVFEAPGVEPVFPEKACHLLIIDVITSTDVQTDFSTSVFTRNNESSKVRDRNEDSNGCFAMPMIF